MHLVCRLVLATEWQGLVPWGDLVILVTAQTRNKPLHCHSNPRMVFLPRNDEGHQWIRPDHKTETLYHRR